nr:MAG TPA: hypothetical protein [Microviridae sp.]
MAALRKFNIHNRAERRAQEYNKEEIKITIAGEEKNVYQMIQEAREDTEIYPTLEKYGCLDKLGVDNDKMFEDMRELGKMNLRDIKEQQKKAMELWYKLPVETRNEFGNNHKEFMEKGEKWLKAKIDKANAEMQAQKLEENVVVKTEAVNNEQK